MSQDLEKNTVPTIESISAPTIWNFNGVEFEFDVTDVDVAEKYEETFAVMGEKEKKLPKEGKQSELLKAQFEWFIETFDRLFGDGAGIKICGGKKSISVCMDAYMSFLAFVKAQKVAIQEKGNSIHSTYSNRAQRRAAAKSSKK